jgi:hypothetical protein
MTEYKVKVWVGLLMVFGQAGILGLVVTLFFMGGLDFDEMTTSFALISPLLAGYTTVILTFIRKNRNNMCDTSPKVNFAYWGLAFFYTLSFLIAICVVLIFKAHNLGFANFEQFKYTLALIETMFGIYVGHFIYTMFQTEVYAAISEATAAKEVADRLRSG